jgi:hypothetical protein
MRFIPTDEHVALIQRLAYRRVSETEVARIVKGGPVQMLGRLGMNSERMAKLTIVERKEINAYAQHGNTWRVAYARIADLALLHAAERVFVGQYLASKVARSNDEPAPQYTISDPVDEARFIILLSEIKTGEQQYADEAANYRKQLIEEALF